MAFRFLDVDELIELHALGLEMFAGSAPVFRDKIEAIDGSVRNAYTEDVYVLAACYVLYINQRHPAGDGVKRLAFSACIRFLSFNGVATGDRQAGEKLEALVKATATITNATDRESIAEQLRIIFPSF